MNVQNQVPLVVDLDGTLIKSDLLLESFYAMVRDNPFSAVYAPVWLLRGKAHLKAQIAQRASVDVSSLPYHWNFLNYLRREHATGRKLVLATASHIKFARVLAGHLNIFDEVLATDERGNLSGRKKLAVLVEKYGDKGFDYAGNDRADLHIFPHANGTILVNPSDRVQKTAEKISRVREVFKEKKAGLLVYLKAVRLYQWVKNVLLFVPLVTSHSWVNVADLRDVLLGFVSFGLCASGGYLFNDFLDLVSDRQHPRKKTRPFASGDIPLLAGSVLMVALKVSGFAMAFVLGWKFFGLLVLYSFMSLAYTLCLKTYVLIDVLVLAGLYTMRILLGAVLVEVPLSFWLLAFSIFIFFSLALVKRCSELIALAKSEGKKEYAAGRDYSILDIGHLREMGISSGYMAILIFAFYINSADVLPLYSRPQALWLAIPALFYWISRIWLKTGRGEMLDDPIVFSVKDRGSRFMAVAVVLIILLAI